MTMPRTLYADDVIANRRYLKAMLEKIGLQTDVAEDGLKALLAWKQSRHSLVLLDINMPGMNGARVSAAIREEQDSDEQITILGITADLTEDLRQELLAAGMDDCITKPTSVEELSSQLSPWLGENQAETPVSESEHRNILQGDTALVEQLMTELPLEAEQLTQAYAQNNREEAKRLAHRMSGVAAMYRLPQLAAAMQVLQDGLGKEQSLNTAELEPVTVALAHDLIDLQEQL